MKKRLLLTVLVSALVTYIVTILVLPEGLSCDEWQERYRKVAQQGQGGAFAFINQGPTAEKLRELEEQRPEDCETPEP